MVVLYRGDARIPPRDPMWFSLVEGNLWFTRAWPARAWARADEGKGAPILLTLALLSRHTCARVCRQARRRHPHSELSGLLGEDESLLLELHELREPDLGKTSNPTGNDKE